MTTNRKASFALIFGSLAGLITMSLHPTSREVVTSLTGGGEGSLNKVVHSLALLAQPLILLGTLVFTLRFTRRRDLAIAAYVFFAWSSVAILLATVMSGFIATEVLASGVSGRATPDAVASSLRYTGIANRAFANVYITFSSLAIVLWSVAILRGKEFSGLLAAYGMIIGLASLLLGRDDPTLTLFGFASVVLSQGVWLIWLALLLRRMP